MRGRNGVAETPGGDGTSRAAGPSVDRGLSLLDHQPGYTPTSTHGSSGLGKEELVAGALAAILAGDETLFAAMVLYRDRAIDFSQLARVVCTLALHHALLGAGERAVDAGASGEASVGGQTGASGEAGAGEAVKAGEATGAGSTEHAETEAVDEAAPKVVGAEGEAARDRTVGSEGEAARDPTVGSEGEAARDRTVGVPVYTGGDAAQSSPQTDTDAHSATGAGQQPLVQQQQQGSASRTTDAGDFATARSSGGDGNVDNADARGDYNEAGAEEEEEAEAEAAESADPSLYADAHVTLLAAMHASGLIEGPDARTLVSRSRRSCVGG
jgi:hypothetical protein